MLKDPLTDWEQGFPYDRLAPAGVGPDSTMKEIADASFVLMEQGLWDASTRDAWDALRRPRGRLEVDFFLLDERVLDAARAQPTEAVHD